MTKLDEYLAQVDRMYSNPNTLNYVGIKDNIPKLLAIVEVMQETLEMIQNYTGDEPGQSPYDAKEALAKAETIAEG